MSCTPKCAPSRRSLAVTRPPGYSTLADSRPTRGNGLRIRHGWVRQPTHAVFLCAARRVVNGDLRRWSQEAYRYRQPPELNCDREPQPANRASCSLKANCTNILGLNRSLHHPKRVGVSFPSGPITSCSRPVARVSSPYDPHPLPERLGQAVRTRPTRRPVQLQELGDRGNDCARGRPAVPHGPGRPVHRRGAGAVSGGLASRPGWGDRW
jgi:hypothetical protein